jgi:hypothetical protein
MNMDEGALQRLAFLVRVVQKESAHLLSTDGRLFASPFTQEDAARLETDVDLAERVEAFVGRFGRLQDTLGDKLLPALLSALGEHAGPFVDNLDRAERLSWISSVDDWLVMRQLRNQMIHEYIEDPIILTSALNAGHGFVPSLLATSARLIDEIEHRWAVKNREHG